MVNLSSNKLPRGAKSIDGSQGSYKSLKKITDPAQAGTLRSWSSLVIKLLSHFDIKTRANHKIIEKTLSFPHDQNILRMAFGIRYERPNG